MVGNKDKDKDKDKEAPKHAYNEQVKKFMEEPDHARIDAPKDDELTKDLQDPEQDQGEQENTQEQNQVELTLPSEEETEAFLRELDIEPIGAETPH